MSFGAKPDGPFSAKPKVSTKPDQLQAASVALLIYQQLHA